MIDSAPVFLITTRQLKNEENDLFNVNAAHIESYSIGENLRLFWAHRNPDRFLYSVFNSGMMTAEHFLSLVHKHAKKDTLDDDQYEAIHEWWQKETTLQEAKDALVFLKEVIFETDFRAFFKMLVEAIPDLPPASSFPEQNAIRRINGTHVFATRHLDGDEETDVRHHFITAYYQDVLDILDINADETKKQIADLFFILHDKDLGKSGNCKKLDVSECDALKVACGLCCIPQVMIFQHNINTVIFDLLSNYKRKYGQIEFAEKIVDILVSEFFFSDRKKFIYELMEILVISYFDQYLSEKSFIKITDNDIIESFDALFSNIKNDLLSYSRIRDEKLHRKVQVILENKLPVYVKKDDKNPIYYINNLKSFRNQCLELLSLFEGPIYA